jgi:hypothetical protein
LIAFFPENEKRYIAYGEDLAVFCSFSDTANELFSAVSLNKGTMMIQQKRTNTRTYYFANSSRESKRLIVEHPFYSNIATLAAPLEYAEKTSNQYRFELTLPQGESTFEVVEEHPWHTSVTLAQRTLDEFVKYASIQAFPAEVRAGLKKAVELRQKIEDEAKKLHEYDDKLERLYKEQERTRKNLEAAGGQTQQGQEYLSRLAAQEKDIDATNALFAETKQAEREAQSAYDDYIATMFFEE